MLSKPKLDAEAKARLKVIFEQLEGKSKLLTNLDSKVLGLCVREIEESETITAKVIELKRRIDSACRRREHWPPCCGDANCY